MSLQSIIFMVFIEVLTGRGLEDDRTKRTIIQKVPETVVHLKVDEEGVTLLLFML